MTIIEKKKFYTRLFGYFFGFLAVLFVWHLYDNRQIDFVTNMQIFFTTGRIISAFCASVFFAFAMNYLNERKKNKV